MLNLLARLLGTRQQQRTVPVRVQLTRRKDLPAHAGNWVYVFDNRRGLVGWVQISAVLSDGNYWVTDGDYTWNLLRSEVYDVRISPPD